MRLALLLLALSTPPAAAGYTAGAAQVDVTPPAGCPMAGYYHARGADGTLDPLYAKALVIEVGGVRSAVVALDLITTTPGIVADARKLVAEKTGIPPTHVMISATHSHTGPVLSDRPRDDAFGGSNKLAVEYRAALPGKIAEAVAKADAARVPVRLLAAVGKEEQLTFNRRFHMTDGTVGWNPGKLNPKIVKPAGPTDPSVPVVLVETADKDRKPLACLVNFAMHLDTVGGTRFSADYPYQLSRCLAAAKGEDFITVFLTGCCGDTNHINVKTDFPQKGPTEAARIGTRLAAAVLRAMDDLAPVADGPVRGSLESVPLDLPAIAAGDLEWAQGIAAEVRKEAKPAPKFMDQVRAFQVLDVTARLGKPIPGEVQVLSFGPDLAVVSQPGEIFTQLGMDIKARSPFRFTLVAELANGSVGYVPDRPAYPQGNYEVVSARVAEGSGEKMVASAVKQLQGQHEKR